MKTYWLGLFESIDDVCREFSENKYKNIDDLGLAFSEILLAYYDYEDYSGEAFVLFLADGRLYEVNSSHCSCYGLEGTWDPETTTIAALRYRLKEGNLGRGHSYYGNKNLFAEELNDVLNQLEAEGYV